MLSYQGKVVSVERQDEIEAASQLDADDDRDDDDEAHAAVSLITTTQAAARLIANCSEVSSDENQLAIELTKKMRQVRRSRIMN